VKTGKKRKVKKSGGLIKMKNKLKDNLILKIISVSIAIIVWLYIQVVQSPVNDFYFYNIEVLDSDGNTIEADILQNRGLYIVEGEKPTVDIHVRTSLLKLMNLKKGSYEARVDLSGAPDSETYPVRIVKKGDNLNDIDISVRNAKQVAIKFEEIEMKDSLAVQVEFDDKKLPDGYYTDRNSITLDMPYIRVKAPESETMENVKAVVDIDLSGKTESFSEDFPVKLVYENGRPVSLKETGIEIVDKKVKANVEILYKKDVELKLYNKNEKLELKVEPSTVTLIGAKDSIKDMLDLTIREYTLEKEEVGYTQKIKIPSTDKYKVQNDTVTVRVMNVLE